MNSLFGTDGIRGVAGRYPMTAEMALRVGGAVAAYFSDGRRRPLIVVGQDTRISGDMLAHALMAGVCAAGGDVRSIGTLPTPAVAQAAVSAGAAAGVMISASHNPYEDNGIKIFDGRGHKLDRDQEEAIEQLVLADDLSDPSAQFPEPGRTIPDPSAADAYQSFLKNGRLHDDIDLGGLKLILDCANGATFEAAPRLFADLGVRVRAMNISPDGRNINAGCGSQHPEALAAAVRSDGADAGLAFDGDGDRVVAVDETGRVLGGDVILAICAHHLKRIGKLPNDLVVSTVMSNLGLGLSLAESGIRRASTDVGDRNVMQEMIRSGSAIGGEDSGHVIFGDYHTTGDGIFTGLRLLEIVARKRRKLSELSDIIKIYPQALLNVDVSSKPPLESISQISAAIAAAESELGDRGRVLVRYSGTQSCCRVMVEGPTEAQTRELCNRIADVIQDQLG